MRISNRPGRLLGYCLVMTILPLSTLFAQEKDANLIAFLYKATEEIPIQSKTRTANPINPPKGGGRTVLQDITEEVPNSPKSKFMSTKSHSGGNFKIQLGYFKEKKNVNKMVKKVKKINDWSVYVKTENNNGTDYYRVMIVDISNKSTAYDIIGQLQSEGLKAVLK